MQASGQAQLLQSDVFIGDPWFRFFLKTRKMASAVLHSFLGFPALDWGTSTWT